MKRLSVLAITLLLAVPSVASAGRAKLTPEQRVNRLWQKVQADYGGGPTPDIRFGKVSIPSRAVTTIQEGHRPYVEVGREVTKALRSRDPDRRREARDTVLWEFGRTIQGDRGDGWLAHKTNTISHRLNKQQNQRLKVKRSKKLGVIQHGFRAKP